jgi:hypothetical protein
MDAVQRQHQKITLRNLVDTTRFTRASLESKPTNYLPGAAGVIRVATGQAFSSARDQVYFYLPTIKIENDMTGPRGPRPPPAGGALAGAGPYSAVMVSM